MKIVCIDPIARGGSLCVVSVFDQNGLFLLQRTLDLNKVPIKENHFYLCYDISKVFNIDNNIKAKLYDIKILYELQHKKFADITRLGIDVLGHDRMFPYLNMADKLQAHLRSYRIASIDVNKFSELQLFSEDLLRSYYREKACVIVELFKEFNQTHFKAPILDFYSRVNHYAKVLFKIEKNPLYIDSEAVLEGGDHHISSIRKAVVDNKIYLKYNVVGAKNGRLSLRKGTPNIYALPKRYRRCIIAPEGFEIVQFDYKSLHPRIAIALTDDDEFKNRFKDIDDIYSIFSGERNKNKLDFIGWMYSDFPNERFEEEAKPIYDLKKELYSEAKRNGMLINSFGRPLFFDDDNVKVVFQNILTSTEVDMMLDLVGWVENALKNRKSNILFLFHDALLCHINEDEMDLIDKIKQYMEVHHQNRFNSKFPVEVTVGKNFGEMECSTNHLTR